MRWAMQTFAQSHNTLADRVQEENKVGGRTKHEYAEQLECAVRAEFFKGLRQDVGRSIL